MEGRDVLHHVRRLRALVDGQPLFGNVPVGHYSTRLQRHAGMPPKDEIRLHHLVGLGKRRIDSASLEVTLERQIVTERRMNHRGFRIERGPHVRYCIQFLVFNPEGFRCVLTHGVMTVASSLPVTIAMTSGIRRASTASMPMIFAWACGERRNTTCAMRGSSMS